MSTAGRERSDGAGRTHRFGQVIAGAAGVFFVVAGAWAFVDPASFYERAATFEPYNAHFVRDIGAFQLGLGAVLLLALVSRDALLVALGGVGVGATVHVIGHVLDRDLGGNPAIDLPGLGLLAVFLVAAAALRLTRGRDGSEVKEPPGPPRRPNP